MKYHALLEKIDEAAAREEFRGAPRSAILVEIHPDDLGLLVADMPGRAMWLFREERTVGGMYVSSNENVERGDARFTWAPTG